MTWGRVGLTPPYTRMQGAGGLRRMRRAVSRPGQPTGDGYGRAVSQSQTVRIDSEVDNRIEVAATRLARPYMLAKT